MYMNAYTYVLKYNYALIFHNFKTDESKNVAILGGIKSWKVGSAGGKNCGESEKIYGDVFAFIAYHVSARLSITTTKLSEVS